MSTNLKHADYNNRSYATACECTKMPGIRQCYGSMYLRIYVWVCMWSTFQSRAVDNKYCWCLYIVWQRKIVNTDTQLKSITQNEWKNNKVKEKRNMIYVRWRHQFSRSKETEVYDDAFRQAHMTHNQQPYTEKQTPVLYCTVSLYAYFRY